MSCFSPVQLMLSPSSTAACNRRQWLRDLRENTRCLGLQRATSSSCLRCCTSRGTSWRRVWRVWVCSPSCHREAILWSQTSPLSVSEELVRLSLMEVFCSSVYSLVCALLLFFTSVCYFPTEVDYNDQSSVDEPNDFRFVKWLTKEKVNITFS